MKSTWNLRDLAEQLLKADIFVDPRRDRVRDLFEELWGKISSEKNQIVVMDRLKDKWKNHLRGYHEKQPWFDFLPLQVINLQTNEVFPFSIFTDFEVDIFFELAWNDEFSPYPGFNQVVYTVTLNEDIDLEKVQESAREVLKDLPSWQHYTIENIPSKGSILLLRSNIEHPEFMIDRLVLDKLARLQQDLLKEKPATKRWQQELEAGLFDSDWNDERSGGRKKNSATPVGRFGVWFIVEEDGYLVLEESFPSLKRVLGKIFEGTKYEPSYRVGKVEPGDVGYMIYGVGPDFSYFPGSTPYLEDVAVKRKDRKGFKLTREEATEVLQILAARLDLSYESRSTGSPAFGDFLMDQLWAEDLFTYQKPFPMMEGPYSWLVEQIKEREKPKKQTPWQQELEEGLFEDRWKNPLPVSSPETLKQDVFNLAWETMPPALADVAQKKYKGFSSVLRSQVERYNVEVFQGLLDVVLFQIASSSYQEEEEPREPTEEEIKEANKWMNAEFGLWVEETMTQPKRAGKKPKRIWQVKAENQRQTI